MKLEPIIHQPTPEELGGRLDRLRAEMGKAGLDWYVAFQKDNIGYLTDFAFSPHERPFILLIPAKGSLKFVCPKVDLPHIRKRSVGDIEFVEYFEFPAPDGEAWFDRLASFIDGGARVGVESVLPLFIYEAIPGQRVRTDIVEELRAIKSPYEIGRMVHSGQLVSAAMKDLLASAKVGRDLNEVGASCRSLILEKLMAEDPLMTQSTMTGGAWFQSPRYTPNPHDFHDLGMTMEEGGPHVSIINGVMRGYGSEIERTFFIGHVPEACKRPYEVMMQGRRLVIDMVKPGARMAEIDKTVKTLFQDEGYELFHRAGHGMGVTAHEGPFLAEGDTHVLEPGMSFSVEPGLYLKGVGGFRHSDTMLVTETGGVLLTDAPDSLEDMTLPLA